MTETRKKNSLQSIQYTCHEFASFKKKKKLVSGLAQLGALRNCSATAQEGPRLRHSKTWPKTKICTAKQTMQPLLLAPSILYPSLLTTT